MKEFEVRIKIRNNLLVERREQLGLSTVQVAKKMGLGYYSYYMYENMKQSPIKKGTRIQWTKVAWKIADFYKVSPGELWPDIVRAVKKNEVKMRIDAEQAYTLMGGGVPSRLLENPEGLVIRKELSEKISVVLETLRPQEEQCIWLRFNEGMTLEQVGEKLNVSRERVRQIEAKALRKLRRSTRAKHLVHYLPCHTALEERPEEYVQKEIKERNRKEEEEKAWYAEKEHKSQQKRWDNEKFLVAHAPNTDWGARSLCDTTMGDRWVSLLSCYNITTIKERDVPVLGSGK